MSDVTLNKEVFINDIKRYLQIDDVLTERKKVIKELTEEKKVLEERILSELENTNQDFIIIMNNKLKKNNKKSKDPLKEDMIRDTLARVLDDKTKANALTEQIMNNRIVKEKSSLTRLKNKND
jgi:DNA-binding transcriptional MerR regulator